MHQSRKATTQTILKNQTHFYSWNPSEVFERNFRNDLYQEKSKLDDFHPHTFILHAYLLMVPRRLRPASLGGAASARTATSLSKRGSIVALTLLTLWMSDADSKDIVLFGAGAEVRLSTGVPGAECFAGIAGTLVLLSIWKNIV